MKKLGKVVSFLIGVGIILAAVALIYSTATGHTTWYFRVDGHVSVDGQLTTGYLHANTERTILLVTRTDAEKPETYLISLGKTKEIFDCGEWHPMRFLPLPVGDLTPTCPGFGAGTSKTGDLSTGNASMEDAPLGKTLAFGRRSVEFSTNRGRKVRAEW